MIDTEGIPNWRRWQAKEQRGVNRGYPQAYINENRADHFVLISTREYEYNNEFKATVKPCTNGNWKGGRSDESRTFEGTPAEADALLAEAEDSAREWMLDHPCEREGTRDDVEFLTDLLNALRDEGIVPQHDSDLKGWTRPGHMDSTTFNIRLFEYDEDEDALKGVSDLDAADVLSFYINVDGKASGLSYREYREYDSDGESRHKHEPNNQSALHGDIEAAFRAVGFEDIHVKNGGYQTHWDHSTGYRVRTGVPDGLDLEPPARDQIRRRRRRRVF